jgi:hypothetical protein
MEINEADKLKTERKTVQTKIKSDRTKTKKSMIMRQSVFIDDVLKLGLNGGK